MRKENYLEKVKRIEFESVNSAEFKFKVEQLKELIKEDKKRKARVKKQLEKVGQTKFFDEIK